ncbi:MAG: FG-GAP repeat domain-containing protein, partial [Candidatus Njordarchaeota archaeon]
MERYEKICLILALLVTSLFLYVDVGMHYKYSTCDSKNFVPKSEETSISPKGQIETIDYNASGEVGQIHQVDRANFSYGECILMINSDESETKYNISAVSFESLDVKLVIDVVQWNTTSYFYEFDFIESGNFDYEDYDEFAGINTSDIWVFDEDGTIIWNKHLGAFDLYVHDLNNDGVDEIIVVGDPKNVIYIFNMTDYSNVTIDNDDYVENILFSDMNNDGVDDIITHGTEANYLYVKIYDGSNYSLISNITINDSIGIYIYAYDFDYDEYGEIFLLYEYNGTDTVCLLEGPNLEIVSSLNTTGIICREDYSKNYYYSPSTERYYFIFSPYAAGEAMASRIALNPWSKAFSQEFVGIEGFMDVYVDYNITRHDEPTIVIYRLSHGVIYYRSDTLNEIVSLAYNDYVIRIYKYDKNGDGLCDVYLISSEMIKVLISDGKPPKVLSLDVNPQNATIDTAIVVTTAIAENHTLYSVSVKFEHTSIDYNTTREMNLKDFAVNIYYYTVYVMGLRYGLYNINIIAEDVFGNIGYANISIRKQVYVHGVINSETLLLSNISSSFAYYSVLYFGEIDVDNDNVSEVAVFLNDLPYINFSIYKFIDKRFVMLFSQKLYFPSVQKSLFKVSDLNNDGVNDIGGVVENSTHIVFITIYGGETISSDVAFLDESIKNVTSIDTIEDVYGHRIPIIGNKNGIYFTNGTCLLSRSNISYIIAANVDNTGMDEIVAVISNESTYILMYNTSSRSIIYENLLLTNISVWDEAQMNPWYSYPKYLMYDYFTSSENKEIMFVAVATNYEVRFLVINASSGDIKYISPFTYWCYFVGIFDYDEDGLKDIAVSINDDIYIYNASFYMFKKFDVDAYTPRVYKMCWDTNRTVLVAIDVGYPNSIIVIDYANDIIREFEVREFSWFIELGEFDSISPYGDIAALSYIERPNDYYDLVLRHIASTKIYKKLSVEANFSSNIIDQLDTFSIKLNLKNFFGVDISDAQCIVYVHSSISNFTYVMLNHENGTYSLNISVNQWGLGIANITVVILHSSYDTAYYHQSCTVVGRLSPRITYSDSIVQGEILRFDVEILDENLNKVYNSNVSAIFMDSVIYEEWVYENKFSLEINTVSLPIGSYSLTLEIENQYAEPLSIKVPFQVFGELHVEVTGTALSANDPVTQGNDIKLNVQVEDSYGSPVVDASVSALFYGKYYAFFSFSNGTYTGLVSTDGVSAGVHTCFLSIEHELAEDILMNLTTYVIGEIIINAELNNTPVYQDTYQILEISLVDKYGYPITDVNIKVSIADRVFYAYRSGELGVYYANLSLFGLYHGMYNITILVEGEYYKTKTYSMSVYVNVKIPKLELSWGSLLILLLVSFVSSGIGLFIYYRLSKAVGYYREREVDRSIKIINIVYGVVLLLFIVTIIFSYRYYLGGLYAHSLGMIALSLLEITLLSALWLYRDIS